MDHSENEQSTIGHEVQAESPDMGIDVDGGGSGCLKKRYPAPLSILFNCKLTDYLYDPLGGRSLMGERGKG